VNQLESAIFTKRRQINMNIIRRIMTANEAWEHAAVGCLERVGYQRQDGIVPPKQRAERLFAVRFDNVHMSVSAAN